MKIHRIATVPALVCFLMLTSTAPLPAANLIAKPGLTVEERWDSNIENTSDNEISDFVTRVAPRLTFQLETYEAQLNLTGGVEFEHYADHDELNERAAFFYSLNSTRPLHLTPRLSVLPAVRFTETNDPLRRVVLSTSPIAGLSPTETVVTARTKSRETSGSLQLTYLVTPKINIVLGGGGSKRTFLDNNAGGVDSDTLFGNALIDYRITPRLSSGLYFNAARNNFENNTDSTTYQLGLSMTYLVSELYTIDAKAGANYIKENTGAGDDTTTSPFGQLALNYTWKDFKTVLLGSYELAGAGSFGVTTHRGTIQVSLTDQFAQGLWWDLSGSYQINQSLDTPRTEDISTWYANAGIRYQATSWAAFRLSGDTVRQRARNDIVGADLDRSSVMIGLDLTSTHKLY